MIYWQLFLSFVQVGMFSIGGGYAAMPLIQSQVVEQHAWLTMQEFTDLITIAEMTPGPIAVNSATFVGLRIASLPGAIIATLGCITPALIFVSLLSYLYRKYKNISLLQNILACLRPVVVALILGAGLSILSTVLFNGNNETLANAANFLNMVFLLLVCMPFSPWPPLRGGCRRSGWGREPCHYPKYFGLRQGSTPPPLRGTSPARAGKKPGYIPIKSNCSNETSIS